MTHEVSARKAFEDLLASLGLGVQLNVRDPAHPRHRFVVMRTTETGIHSGRPRYLVACTFCNRLVHEATTGPWENIERHLQGRD